MPSPNEKLASSLEELRIIQEKLGNAIKSNEISRTHKERLINNGFLTRVAKGWYIISNPNELDGETTLWYASYWKFCSRYLADKFGTEYCLSAEQSLLIHGGCTTIPSQLVVRSPKASNKTIDLIYGTSLYLLKSDLDTQVQFDPNNSVQIMTKESALIRTSSRMFEQNPIEMRTVLALIKDSSGLLKLLLEGSHSIKAGRIIGAFRNIRRDKIADEISKTMSFADFKIRESDPFKNKTPLGLDIKEPSPYANRIRLLWTSMREVVIDILPKSSGLPSNNGDYLKTIDDIYVTDAYHSLSIEKYVVSKELIEKVKSGDWNLDIDENRKHVNTMAARGYWQASQAVKATIHKILKGENPGDAFDEDHGGWYRELFGPSVAAGILNVSELAGYRNTQVYITNSMHTPLNRTALLDALPAFMELLKNEGDAGVRVVLGHFFFVYIHPYVDGNGRMARFLMNTMLASGGYPWTVIPFESRDEYMASLEEASVRKNIEPFAKFIGQLVQSSINGKPIAK